MFVWITCVSVSYYECRISLFCIYSYLFFPQKNVYVYILYLDVCVYYYYYSYDYQISLSLSLSFTIYSRMIYSSWSHPKGKYKRRMK